jgi:hypothetical protein
VWDLVNVPSAHLSGGNQINANVGENRSWTGIPELINVHTPLIGVLAMEFNTCLLERARREFGKYPPGIMVTPVAGDLIHIQPKLS